MPPMPCPRAPARTTACLLAALACAAPALADTDIASEPLITMSEVTAKPNIMFILDNSGSMDRAYMPDDMSGTSTYGYYAAQCNGLAYDPSVTYTPPVDAAGTSYAAASFTAAWTDGYSTGDGTVNLGTTGSSSTSITSSSVTVGTGTKTFTISTGTSSYSTTTFTVGSTVTIASSGGGMGGGGGTRSMTGTVTGWAKSGSNWVLTVSVASTSGSGSGTSWTVTTLGAYYYTYSGSQTAVDWTYTSSGSLDTSTTFYKECMSGVGSSPGSSVFTKVTVTSGSSEATNYANWYSYYRKRYLLMRTTVGQAFTALGSGYRVGFSTISDTSVKDGTNYFRDVKDFGATQKSNFYGSLYSAEPSGNTPLRLALSKAGRYYAKKMGSQSYDPMEYSCQRNYAILSTDGYWNSSAGVQLDGSTAIGDQDGSEARPMYDATKTASTLADVAEYYWKTDLRTAALGNCSSSTSGESQDVCANSVPETTRDNATHQHMTTFTVGLGVNGTLAYDKNYLTQTSGDYVNLSNGTTNWPTPAFTTSGGDARNIDDLWHAAVNGRGQYYSARNASQLAEAISGVVTSIQEVTGSGSAAATNTLDLIAGDNNVVYQASYTTSSWTGDVQAYALNGSTGAVSGTAQWSAQTQLDNLSAASRNIYFASGGALTAFDYANLSGTQQAHFDNLCSQAIVASQCTTLSAANLVLANKGENLVNYLRGVRTYEASNGTSPLYRTRSHLLGDIVGGTPVYVAAPPFGYSDSGYSSFATAQAARTAMVYVPANDGMLHALNAATGKEAWAFVPTAVLPNLYRLADTAYPSKHTYFVDGAPVMGDIYAGGGWRTILVGGLNSGGKAYYALDITTPGTPKLLWEFTDTNLGLSYGNPIITKRSDGTWVVAFGSGYNNTGGDGVGHLFVLNAYTGAKLLDIKTSAGSASDPSGLARVNAWIDDATDNTAKRFYGADLLGNVWRFDTENLVKPYQSALLLAKLTNSAGAAQPVTTQPLPALVSSTYPVVVVGTGEYLGTSDITTTGTQTLYAIKDPLTATGWGTVRGNTAFVQQAITVSGTTATITSKTVDWSSKAGWYVDLPTAGERIVTDMALTSGTVIAASAIPSGDACTSGGSSWLYQISLTSGSSTTDVGQLLSSDTLAIGITAVKLADGTLLVFVKDSEGKLSSYSFTGSAAGVGTPRRSAWRELAD